MELKEILSKLIENKGITAYELSLKSGVPHSTISRILSGETKKLSTKSKTLLANYFNVEEDVFNKTEIVVKEDAEIITSPNGKFQKKKMDLLVPFYDIDFAAGNDLVLVDNNKVTPDYYMDVPEFSGCTAFKAYSDSMENLIKSGNILFGTKVEEWHLHLEYGQIYGIICNDGRRYLKYIRKFIENPKEYFLLKSENPNYDDFEIPKVAIRSIWLIHGWLNKRT